MLLRESLGISADGSEKAFWHRGHRGHDQARAQPPAYDVREPDDQHQPRLRRVRPERAAAPRPSRSRRSCRRPTASCRCARHALAHPPASPHVLAPHARERAAHDHERLGPLRHAAQKARDWSRAARAPPDRPPAPARAWQSARARARARAAQRAAPRGARRCPRSRTRRASSAPTRAWPARGLGLPRLAAQQVEHAAEARGRATAPAPSPRSPSSPRVVSGWPNSSVLSGGMTLLRARACADPGRGRDAHQGRAPDAQAARGPLSDDPEHPRLQHCKFVLIFE